MYTFSYYFWGAQISLQILLNLEGSFNTHCVIRPHPICRLQKQISICPHGPPLPCFFSIPYPLVAIPFQESKTCEEKLNAKMARIFLAKTISMGSRCPHPCVLGVYVCVYMYVYACVWFIVHVHICIFVYCVCLHFCVLCMYMSMYVCICVYLGPSVCLCICKSVCVYMQVCVHVYVCAHMCMFYMCLKVSVYGHLCR